MADTTSIFYKIGQATKSSVGNAIDAFKAANNTFTGTNDFNKAVTVGTDGAAANLTVKGDLASVKVTASGEVSGASATITNGVTAASVSATGAVSGGSVSTLGGVSSATLSTTGNATIGGDLTVTGTTTTLSTTQLEVKDNIVHISKGASLGTYDKDSGFYFERGVSKDAAALVFDESADSFVVGKLAGTPAVGNVGDAGYVAAIPASGSTDDIASATPSALTVGSLKLNTMSLGDFADFEAGFIA